MLTPVEQRDEASFPFSKKKKEKKKTTITLFCCSLWSFLILFLVPFDSFFLVLFDFNGQGFIKSQITAPSFTSSRNNTFQRFDSSPPVDFLITVAEFLHSSGLLPSAQLRKATSCQRGSYLQPHCKAQK